MLKRKNRNINLRLIAIEMLLVYDAASYYTFAIFSDFVSRMFIKYYCQLEGRQFVMLPTDVFV